jgi:hypothetical protein
MYVQYEFLSLILARPKFTVWGGIQTKPIFYEIQFPNLSLCFGAELLISLRLKGLTSDPKACNKLQHKQSTRLTGHKSLKFINKYCSETESLIAKPPNRNECLKG